MFMPQAGFDPPWVHYEGQLLEFAFHNPTKPRGWTNGDLNSRQKVRQLNCLMVHRCLITISRI